jgi:enoyl-CoA hydratase
MGTDETVLVTTGNGVATVTLHRPDSLNAITPEMLDRLGEHLEAIASDPDVQALVLTGAGRAFSAGVDLKALGERSLTGGTVGDLLDVPARKVIDLLVSIPKVVIARVNGACFTGALELALACDLMVVADEAKLGDTHTKWGLRPTWGMSQRLIRTVGVSRARYLSYTSVTFSGEEAARWGMAIRSVPRAELDSAVEEILTSLAANSNGSLAAYKDLYRASLDSSLTDGLAYEASTHYRIDDTDERLTAFR